MRFDEVALSLVWNVARSSSLEGAGDAVVEFLHKIFRADLVAVTVVSDHEPALVRSYGTGEPIVPPEAVSSDSYSGAPTVILNGVTLFLPLFESDTDRSILVPTVASLLRDNEIRSLGVAGFKLPGDRRLVIECQHRTSYHQFNREDQDFLLVVGKVITRWCNRPLLASDLESQGAGREVGGSFNSEYARLLTHGNLIIIRTNQVLHVIDVVGNTEKLFGIAPNEFIHSAEVWTEFLHHEDRKRLVSQLKRAQIKRETVDSEVRIIHQTLGNVRWIALRAVPLFDSLGVFIGWEGFGVDITERRLAEERLARSRSRLTALYHVTRGITPSMEPANIGFRALTSLLSAIDSNGGLVALVDKNLNQLELLAAQGLEEGAIVGADAALRDPEFLIKLQNAATDPNGSYRAIAEAHLQPFLANRGLFLVPLAEGETWFGILCVFHSADSPLRMDDQDLVKAVGAHVALTIQQAEYVVEERAGARQISVLYRLSHELSKYLTPREVAEHAFPIIQDEFPLKRVWLGVLNDQRTHIVGQGAVGPGMRSAVGRAQIELELRHDYLDEAIRTRQPVIVPVGAPMECSGFNRLIGRLKVGVMIILPLVSLGQIVGVMLIEPSAPSMSAAQKRLPMLVQMASEIATVLLARRFEEKIADSDKMRMAGVLASGVAHNFNNLLQAVMGQASLIEMQSQVGTPAARSAKMIMEAATRGASMVAQLLTFSSTGSIVRESIDLNQLLHESREFYRSILGKRIALIAELEAELPLIQGSYSQLQQVLSNLILNAKDAVVNSDDPKVRISTREVRLVSGEVHPELAPGAYIRIDVEDNGVGMNAEEQRRCFEPFFTTKLGVSEGGAGGAGTGLGLSSAYSIVKSHLGIISVQSTPREGSIFSVYLPVPLRIGSEAVVPAPTPALDGDILVVSKDATFRNSLRTFGEGMGLVVSELSIMDTFQSQIEMAGFQPSVIVMDADSAPESTELILTKAIAFKGRVLVATEDTARWEELLPSGTTQFRIFRKPFGAWSVYAALSGVFPHKEEKPLSSNIEKIVTPPHIESDDA